MTHEEAIELLSGRYMVMSMCADKDDCIKNNAALDTAIEALKKQIPMKPNVHEEEYIIDFKCPKCGCRLLSRTVGKHVAGSCYPYCFMCGQHIDWEGVE